MDFDSMNKTALRNACKTARISYGGMTLEAMRAALREHAAQVQPETVQSDAPVLHEEHKVQLDTLGLYGMGDEHNPVCPHCGIDHIDNGFTTPDTPGANELQGRTLHQLGQQHAEFACMGCGGEWGPVRDAYVPVKPVQPASKGLRIQKDRVERNGLKQPSAGGMCRAVWDWCSAQSEPPTAKQLKAAAAEHGWNANNASIEFYRWRKWAAPTAEELLHAHEAARNARVDEALAATTEPDAA